jgi:nitroimidazol reductase NimA-like FMN-containing flavoprotein (pyridoxamine 5'-phosphate oxidase superfamily)
MLRKDTALKPEALMLTEIKELIKEKNICVLATISGNRPYCSLMAYATNEDCTEIYMATRRSTKKARNLSENPAVSLMIDTREEAPSSQPRALTIEGACAPIEDETRKQLVRTRLLSIHPHLKKIISHPDSEIYCVTISSFLLLKGLTEAHYADLRTKGTEKEPLFERSTPEAF